MMTGFIIHDDGRGVFGPLTDLRPAFRLRTGAQLTIQRISRRLGGSPVASWVPENLAGVHAEQVQRPVNELPEGDTLLCVNGRWSGLGNLKLPKVGSALVDAASGDVVMANLTREDAKTWLQEGTLSSDVGISNVDAIIYEHPWDILDHLEATLLDDLGSTEVSVMSEDKMHVHGDHEVHLHSTADILPGVVADTTRGPVVIDAQATIRCNVVLNGPCFIGAGTTISDGAVIKACSSFGPECRIGGEVGASIFQGFSNKSHEGHLGDSLVGCWVNLGAGTSNSNLLNTYSEVIMRLHPEDQTRRTGRIFMGSVIGDHVRTAILTRLMTGCVLGTGSMIASTTAPPSPLPAFTWLTDQGARSYRFDKFIAVARTVMARRGKEPGDAEVAALQRLAEVAAENGD